MTHSIPQKNDRRAEARASAELPARPLGEHRHADKRGNGDDVQQEHISCNHGLMPDKPAGVTAALPPKGFRKVHADGVIAGEPEHDGDGIPAFVQDDIISAADGPLGKVLKGFGGLAFVIRRPRDRGRIENPCDSQTGGKRQNDLHTGMI